jgi:uncharacterized protein YuzE
MSANRTSARRVAELVAQQGDLRRVHDDERRLPGLDRVAKERAGAAHVAPLPGTPPRHALDGPSYVSCSGMAGTGRATVIDGAYQRLEFDYVDYDERADVLYLSIGEPRPPAREEVTPDGHLVRYDEDEKLAGITLVNAKWLIERDGQIGFPVRVDLAAQDIEAALA